MTENLSLLYSLKAIIKFFSGQGTVIDSLSHLKYTGSPSETVIKKGNSKKGKLEGREERLNEGGKERKKEEAKNDREKDRKRKRKIERWKESNKKRRKKAVAFLCTII